MEARDAGMPWHRWQPGPRRRHSTRGPRRTGGLHAVRMLDMDGAHLRKVDDEAIVAKGAGRRRVASASDGGEQAVLAREVDGGDDVGESRAAGYERRPFGHARVPGCDTQRRSHFVSGVNNHPEMWPDRFDVHRSTCDGHRHASKRWNVEHTRDDRAEFLGGGIVQCQQLRHWSTDDCSDTGRWTFQRAGRRLRRPRHCQSIRRAGHGLEGATNVVDERGGRAVTGLTLSIGRAHEPMEVSACCRCPAPPARNLCPGEGAGPGTASARASMANLLARSTPKPGTTTRPAP